MIKHFIFATMIAFLVSCASTKVTTKDNAIIFKEIPNFKLVINDSNLLFCCENKDQHFLKYRDAAGGSSIENHVYVFADIKDKYVKRALYIWISKTSKGAWLSDIYGNVGLKIDYGVKKIHGTNHQYCTFLYDNILSDVKNAIYEEGYLLEGVYLNHSIGKIFGRENNSKYYIDYIESVTDMNAHWDNPKSFSQAQKVKLENFLSKANSVFRIE